MDETRIVALRDLGFNPYGNSIIANGTWLSENPDLAKAFVQVTQRAYAQCVVEPEPCIEVLADAGVIRVGAETAVESGLSSVFYPHGLGHFLGLQVHDVAGLIDNDGQPIPRPEGHPALRLTRVLEEGNVLTVEPGLYFIDTLLEKWRANEDASMVDWDRVEALKPFGGIRIEDNVVVRADGCDNLTRKAFAAL